MPTPSQEKRAKHKAQFAKIGAAISALKPNYIDIDYHTGKESSFYMFRGDSKQREDPSGELQKVELPGGPKFKTPQWLRTVKP